LSLEQGQSEIDAEFIGRLNDDDQRYILDREVGHEAALDRANAKASDALEACADYNNRLNRLGVPNGPVS